MRASQCRLRIESSQDPTQPQERPCSIVWGPRNPHGPLVRSALVWFGDIWGWDTGRKRQGQEPWRSPKPWAKESETQADPHPPHSPAMSWLLSGQGGPLSDSPEAAAGGFVVFFWYSQKQLAALPSQSSSEGPQNTGVSVYSSLAT